MSVAKAEWKPCERCKGSGMLDYTITNHGERDEVVRDKCRYCNGTGRA